MKPQTFVSEWADYEESGIWVVTTPTVEVAQRVFSLLAGELVKMKSIDTLTNYVQRQKQETLSRLRSIAKHD